MQTYPTQELTGSGLSATYTTIHVEIVLMTRTDYDITPYSSNDYGICTLINLPFQIPEEDGCMLGSAVG